MTESSSSTIPAGWYPDPAGGSRTRWWDGTQWTEHFQEPYTTTPGVIAQAPAGTQPYTPWIWAILGIMVLQILPQFFVNYDDYLGSAVSGASTSSTDLALGGIGWLFIAALVIFAALDYRQLKAKGVPQPFHWAWMFFAFITPLVYVIGRSVVIRRRVGSGLAPLWIAVGLTVLSFVTGVLLVAPAMFRVFDQLMQSGY